MGIQNSTAAAFLAVTLCAVYGCDAGRGFIKDDFRWIRETRVQSPSDLAELFSRTDGFYRPLVSVSFAVNSATSGTSSRPYGLTNVALLIINAVLVWTLARRLDLAPEPALLAAGAWAFNFHGINMAVLWVCGRTALMAALGALLTAIAIASRRPIAAGLCCLVALLSREDAVLLPVLFAGWVAFDASGSLAARLVAAARLTWPLFAALAAYLVLRLRTAAFWPGNAPDYYQFTSSPAVLVENLLQYADRAITWPAFAALVVVLASARTPRLDARERRAAAFGAMWLAGTFALTVLIPVRSSLYAVVPSIGAALASGAVASAAIRADRRRTAIALTALVLLPALLLPVYWSRNRRWVRLAELSTIALEQTRQAAAAMPGTRVVLRDNPSERFTLEAAFGSLWPDAFALFLPHGTRAEIVPDGARDTDAIVLQLTGDRLVRKK